MDLIVKMQFGSHVYGTNTENSDTDYKGIYIPNGKDILLGKVQETIQNSTGSNNSKNTKDDIDLEILSLKKFLDLASQGQTVALDMLFAPEEFWIESSPLWRHIIYNRQKLIHSQVNSFVGYVKTQANKYGIRGSRMGSVETAIKVFKDILLDLDKGATYGFSMTYTLESVWSSILTNLSNVEHINFIQIQLDKKTGSMIDAVEICGRKFGCKETIKRVIETLEEIYSKYGDRAKAAKDNEGIDWKALMHAVRISNQAIELFNTQHITFPRPEAPLLLQIRKGLIPYTEVSALIEDGLIQLEKAMLTSKLQDRPDQEFIDNLIIYQYRQKAMEVIDVTEVKAT